MAYDPRLLSFDEYELRVIGCLIEKQYATPDQYPLTTNALVLACNQSTNRQPVVTYTTTDIQQAMLRLRERDLARDMHQTGARVTRHRHLLEETLGLGRAEQAVLALLALRGPQTAAEIRARSERLYEFTSLAAVEEIVDRLAGRAQPMVARLDRQPGEKAQRIAQIVGDAGPAVTVSPRVVEVPAPVVGTAPPSPQLAELLTEVASLRARVERLEAELGVDS